MRELSQKIKDKIYERNKYIDNIKVEDCDYFEIKIKFITPRA
jgi:hypothetical protein